MHVQAVLSAAGHSVIKTAPTFNRALEIAEVRRPDLAIVDYNLGGGMDGVMLAGHLRRLGVKVPYITGYGHEVRLIDRTAVTSANPYNADMLMRAIQRVIASASDEN